MQVHISRMDYISIVALNHRLEFGSAASIGTNKHNKKTHRGFHFSCRAGHEKVFLTKQQAFSPFRLHYSIHFIRRLASPLIFAPDLEYNHPQDKVAKMQFYTVIALLAATSLALPTISSVSQVPRGLDLGLPSLDNIEAELGDSGKPAEKDDAAADATAGTCDLLKCAAALGPLGVGCVASAAQAFLDPITDAACLASALNDFENKPTECDGCSKDV